jgi:hypothetical protein
MTKKITHDELSQMVKLAYKYPDKKTGKKIPLLITGTFGIGKSMVIKYTGKVLSVEREVKREYLDWNEISYEQKMDILNNNKVKDYFTIIDMRLSQFDATDIRGLPDFDKLRKWVEWKYPFFVELLQHPDSDGILFFDEFNLATPLVMSSCYQIFHDKIIGDTRINPNWLVIGCGNNEDDRANTHEIAPPLKDRCLEAELTPPTPKEWVKWAVKNGLSPRIIAYITWKGTSLRKVNFNSQNKYTTERGWERLNCFMSCNLDEIRLISGTAIGEDIAAEFMGFLEIEGKINLDEIIKKPETLRGITDPGQKYFVVSGLAEKYKDNLMTMEQLFETSTVLHEMKSSDFVALLWRLASRMNKTKFRKEFTTKELKHPLKQIFFKYLTDD